MHTNIDVAEVLEDSAERVFAHGLTKGIIGTPGDAQCTVGYLNTSAWKRLGYTLPKMTSAFFMPQPLEAEPSVRLSVRSVIEDAIKAMRCVINDRTRIITAWSDDESTTPEMVRDTMILAAKEIRNDAKSEGGN